MLKPLKHSWYQPCSFSSRAQNASKCANSSPRYNGPMGFERAFFSVTSK